MKRRFLNYTSKPECPADERDIYIFKAWDHRYPAPPLCAATVAAPIRIVVPGAIVPWRRAQRRRLGTGAVVSFTAPAVAAYHSTVRLVAERAMNGRPPFAGAIEMTVVAVFAVPSSWSQKRRAQALAGTIQKTSRPDIENAIKGVQDSLQTVVYCDDSQIVSLIARKVYGDRPRLEIELQPI